jgi:hypothetical protein
MLMSPMQMRNFKRSTVDAGFGQFSGLFYNADEAQRWCDQKFPVARDPSNNAKCKDNKGCVDIPFLGQQCAGAMAPWTTAGQMMRGIPSPPDTPASSGPVAPATAPGGPSAPVVIPMIGAVSKSTLAIGAAGLAAIAYLALRKH